PVPAMMYSQVDITEAFGDDQRLGPDEWIVTVPLNATTPDPESMGLPPVGADADEVHRVASKLSELRESIPVPNDGVYCPVCHIANVARLQGGWSWLTGRRHSKIGASCCRSASWS